MGTDKCIGAKTKYRILAFNFSNCLSLISMPFGHGNQKNRKLGGNETFGLRLINSGSLFWLIWSENANMSNVKGGWHLI